MAAKSAGYACDCHTHHRRPMPTFNFDVDDAALLKAYKISSLSPSYVLKKNLKRVSNDGCLTSSQWEEVDYDLDDAMAGSSTSPTGTSADEVADPLGLGNQIK
jgi:exocyst complex component 2